MSAPVVVEPSALALRAWRRAGGPLRLLVRGWSMAPLLRPGDLIDLAAVPLAQLRPGAILVVEQGAGLLTHRLLRAEAGQLWLWGDALPRPDPPIAYGALLGQVVARERAGARLSLQHWPWPQLGRAMLHTPLRRLARVLVARHRDSAEVGRGGP